MAKETQVKCRRCGKMIPLSTADVIESELLCLDCQTGKTILPNKKDEGIFSTVESKKGKTRYVCNKCSYNFYRSPTSSTALKCPYCDSKEVTKHTKTNAAGLIKEIEGFDKYKFFKDR
jgi:DNA-directed RNA polymerase subunit RPC12/RpoP